MSPIKISFKSFARTGLILGLTLMFATATAFGQGRGRLTGRVLAAANAPAGGGVVVVATNQITGNATRTRTSSDGAYSMRLSAGAYRIKVEAPYMAKFEKGGKFGDFALPRGEYIENVFVEGGKDTPLDIPLSDAKKDTQLPVQAVAMANGGNGDGEGEPLGYAGRPTVESEPQTRPDRRDVRDRWRVAFPEYDRYGSIAGGRDVPFKRGKWYDPYNQNLLKGDYPIFGNNVFMVLSGLSKLSIEQRRLPTPSNLQSARPGSAEFFGQPEILAVNHILQFTFEMFKGDTTFKPREWAFKFSPTFSAPNYLDARETTIINIDPRRGTNRTDTHFSFEDAFVEYKVEDVNANFDFISVRAGIQPFVSDFRGFIYSDNNLGVRIFGGLDNNRYQYNFAYFGQLEKDTNSGLNRFDKREQGVYIANFFRQDFLAKGYTGQLSFHFNDDRRSVEFDRNGFLVRPAIAGSIRPHSVKVGYLGFAGDGHFAKINLSNAYYIALGRDDFNPIANRPVSVRAQMAVAEASMDRDYLRFRTTFFWAQGDGNPEDGKATGFDAIFDDPNIIGGQFSFWNRVGIPLTGAGVGLVQPNSVLPSLRSSKSQGQANHVNPGIFIYNAGLDVEVTQRIKAIFNLNYMQFHRTESLERLIFQDSISKEIGYDLSLGVIYRPLLINNIQFTFGGSLFKPGRGFRDIYTDRGRNCPPNVRELCTSTSDDIVIDPKKPLYNLFTELKLIF